MDINTEKLRHSASHVLAMAVMRLYPDTKLGIGPVTEDGFYYDFEIPEQLEWEDVKQIESEMNLIIQENHPFTQLIVPREQAYNILLSRGQMYKAELMQDVKDSDVSFYKTGEDFIDLCRGPHMKSTGEIGVVKLIQITESFWQGDHSRPQLQRISGIAFEGIDELKKHLQTGEDVKNRDFRRLAQLLKLTIGGHENLYTPEGTQVINTLQNLFIENIQASGFSQIQVSGNHSFKVINDGLDEYYSSKQRSYKELPVKVYVQKLLELDEVFKISGKDIRIVNCITAKDYFSLSQFKVELQDLINALLETFRKMGVTVTAEVVLPNLEVPELPALTDILLQAKLPQVQIVDPKIKQNEITIRLCHKDSLHRDWELIEVIYTKEKDLIFNTKQSSTSQIHSFSTHFVAENLMAYFLEDQSGGLPIWLAPIQTIIIPISEAQNYYAKEVNKLLQAQGIRSRLDDSTETMKAKIRDAEINKIPAIIIVGEKETSNNSVSLRLRDGKEIGLIGMDKLISTLQQI